MNEYLRETATAEMKEKLIWLLRSHCIVEKEMVMAKYNATMIGATWKCCAVW